MEKQNVYVISKKGKPLMPCTPCKAKKLLKSSKAEIFKLYPFTIKLKFDCDEKVQNVTMGVDTGAKNIGFSCINDKKELASGTVLLDCKTSERIRSKAMYRSLKRSRLWHRKPRFNNRTKPVGWLPPSTDRKYKTHLKLINLYSQLLPISKVIIEIANFDVQKILNPDIKGKEYQEGNLHGYQNMRSYLLAREKGKCQICKNIFEKNDPSHIHHIIERANGGTDRSENLAILHKSCHINLHKNGLKLKANKQYKESAFMNIIKNRFIKNHKNFDFTFGYITFLKRISLGLNKTHFNDAFVIAGGEEQSRICPIEITQKRRNNRAIQLNRRGFKPSIRKNRYKIQPKDIIWVSGKKEISAGCHKYGKNVVIYPDKKSIHVKNVEKIYNFGSFCYSN